MHIYIYIYIYIYIELHHPTSVRVLLFENGISPACILRPHSLASPSSTACSPWHCWWGCLCWRRLMELPSQTSALKRWGGKHSLRQPSLTNVHVVTEVQASSYLLMLSGKRQLLYLLNRHMKCFCGHASSQTDTPVRSRLIPSHRQMYQYHAL